MPLADADDNKYKELFKGLSEIDVKNERESDGYFHASLIELKVPKVRKNSCNKGKKEEKESEQEEVEEEVERDMIARIRCTDKVALQMIKLSLQDAKEDKKQIGRPLTL